jgi:hypothetical protein
MEQAAMSTKKRPSTSTLTTKTTATSNVLHSPELL